LLSRIALERPGVVTASTRLRSRPAAILGYRPAGSARCRTFNEIADGAPGLSRGLLSKRLRDLERAGPGSRSWLLIERGDAEICEKHPGGDEDLVVVVSDPVAFARWDLGELEWSDALRGGAIQVRGPRALARALPTWKRRVDPLRRPPAARQATIHA
jgi:hypothetical protein